MAIMEHDVSDRTRCFRLHYAALALLLRTLRRITGHGMVRRSERRLREGITGLHRGFRGFKEPLASAGCALCVQMHVMFGPHSGQRAFRTPIGCPGRVGGSMS